LIAASLRECADRAAKFRSRSASKTTDFQDGPGTSRSSANLGSLVRPHLIPATRPPDPYVDIALVAPHRTGRSNRVPWAKRAKSPRICQSCTKSCGTPAGYPPIETRSPRAGSRTTRTPSFRVSQATRDAIARR
jgi:hypothetical protein